MIRAFFAVGTASIETELVQLTKQLKSEISARRTHQNGRSPLRWVEHQNFHLTLAFLGNIKHTDLPLLVNAAKTAVQHVGVMTLQFDCIQWFPPNKHAKVLAALTKPNTQLNALQAQLCAQLAASGFEMSKHHFTPHITLARRNKNRALGELRDFCQPCAADLCLPVDEFSLYSSTQGAGSVIYTPLFSQRLIA